MKHFVIIIDWATDDDNGHTILGVAHSKDEAKLIFNQNLIKEKEIADEEGFTIYEDEETCFDAGEDGNYIANHRAMIIEEI